MHTHQTLDFVKQKHSEWTSCTHTQMGMMDAILSLDQLVDESDPDVDFPNSFHAFQTAEGIRKEHPDKDWFQLVGLIHDVGKIMALWDEPQWAVVGDTFPVGCRFQNSIVFRDNTFLDNPDEQNPIYKFGLYMIRFHSFYPWHSHGDYMNLCNDKDLRMLPWVKEFNKFDLYTRPLICLMSTS
ncbi:hypothetical protein INR49_007846 [Caranx melampygus]|nr:hypothetical protein INR49_007846 [Caranx melampygus]